MYFCAIPLARQRGYGGARQGNSMLRLMAFLGCRPAAALIVAAAIAMQAFLAGLAAAEGARVATPGASDFAIICHGGGPSDQGNGTAPDPTGAKHPCCMSCAAAASILGGPPSVFLPRRGQSLTLLVPSTPASVIARRAVRAGLSQAPPSQI
jgi:hypothetical protein